MQTPKINRFCGSSFRTWVFREKVFLGARSGQKSNKFLLARAARLTIELSACPRLSNHLFGCRASLSSHKLTVTSRSPKQTSKERKEKPTKSMRVSQASGSYSTCAQTRICIQKCNACISIIRLLLVTLMQHPLPHRLTRFYARAPFFAAFAMIFGSHLLTMVESRVCIFRTNVHESRH